MDRCTKGHEGSSYDPDENFCCKMAHVRARGGLGVLTPRFMGRDGVSFYDTTIREMQDAIKARARRNGWEARQKHPLYDRTPAGA